MNNRLLSIQIFLLIAVWGLYFFLKSREANQDDSQIYSGQSSKTAQTTPKPSTSLPQHDNPTSPSQPMTFTDGSTTTASLADDKTSATSAQNESPDQAQRIAREHTPPDYLKDYVIPAGKLSPASLLADGKWCGHGEPLWNLFTPLKPVDTFLVRFARNTQNTQQNPRNFFLPLVQIASTQSPSNWIAIYDPRLHPASPYAKNKEALQAIVTMDKPLLCPRCGGNHWRIAMGFEIPADASNPNDTSWFALSVDCVNCTWSKIIFDDETN